ncbi:LysR substrate-binding domain-containing protein [Piscinibacter sakaiensis]|uniref:Transcriptional regulator n=1 Tax=Piscinibacter sakaiensis TaxID=1547922 RepID=A0A0K8P389_PISS1|nr:LysR substrate-binding domain-containing protein [Piscinibacter sakaiensis]GAP37078.1 transcriptional regulator [Piscinibacter sakaiensis]
METKWLEDFVSLAETRSFSRSAQLRHVTQPAFSRRIQALEAWAGIDLVDRSAYPTRLTPAGETFHAQALEILGNLQAARNLLRSHQAGAQDMIEFAVPHSLAFTFFPHWVMDLRQHFGNLKSRLIALNVHDAVMQLTEGGCDLLIAYHHPSQPLQLNPDRYEMLSLGHETLAPYAKAVGGTGGGAPLFALPPPAGRSVPFLAYASGAYLGRLVEVITQQAQPALNLEPIYETDMAEGLKAMALEGHGVAFLPASSVRKELKAHRLVRAAPAGQHELTMEVRIYRERPELSRLAKAGARALWEFLRARSERRPPAPAAAPPASRRTATVAQPPV